MASMLLSLLSSQRSTCSLLRSRRSVEFLESGPSPMGRGTEGEDGEPTIIIITPTYKRLERFADMTRLSQTLMNLRNLHWIVVEDGLATVPAVERILRRSGIPYKYLHGTTPKGVHNAGWAQRDVALMYMRAAYKNYGNAVVYFADDDNSYDLRLFENYIRKVKRIGVWAVGTVGSALVEAPQVVNDTVVGWQVVQVPERRYAVDMAAFAVHLNEYLRVSTAYWLQAPESVPSESTFLGHFGIPIFELEPFGHNESPKELLVWHTKTYSSGVTGESHGYLVER